jgi:hypothetical protein
MANGFWKGRRYHLGRTAPRDLTRDPLKSPARAR